MKKPGFSPAEKKAIAGLSAVIGFRMLGLSALIPVFSVYALSLPGSSPMLAGLAFGVYGLTQALLQIPFGFMSDKYGRKPVVVVGLAIFGIGSVIAAMTGNIYTLIAARFLQGAGAIASACFAWIADLTDASRRNMAMAFMGISIGGGITLGMIFGPVLGSALGVPFLFWMAALLSVLAIYITLFILREPEKPETDVDPDFALNPRIALKYAATWDLFKLDLAGFIVNTSMIGTFFIVPLRLAESFAMSELWQIYLPFSVFGCAAMMFSSIRADRGSAKEVIAMSHIFIALSFFGLALGEETWVVIVSFGIFFSAFSALEATLPAAVTKLADPEHKGSIVGVYNFSQFMGTFVGGVSAGLFAGVGGSYMCVLAISNVIAAGLVYSATGINKTPE